jgi:hypothetical protein
VGQYDTVIGGGPRQNVRVRRMHQANIPNAHEIQTGHTGKQSAGEPAVKILIRQ